MKRTISSLIALVLSIISQCAIASTPVEAPVPQAVVSECRQRNQQMNTATYNWEVERQEMVAPVPSQSVPQMRKRLTDGLIKILHERGMTNPTTVQRDVESMTGQITTQWKGADYNSLTTWQFIRNGQQVFVDGSKDVGGSQTSYRQFYSGDDCVVDNYATSSSNQVGPHRNPFVWAAASNAVMYRCPLLGQSLDLSPGHFVTLMSLNPLNMFGGHWTLQTTTDKDWVVQAHVNQGVLSPATVEMSLSRTHNAAPDQIIITGIGYVETIKALHYRQYQGAWICDKATYVKEIPGNDTLKEAFILKDVNLNGQINFQLAPTRSVEDYRLLGADFIDPLQFIPAPTAQQATEVVYYSWGGHFPTIDELQRLYSKEHPGEGRPDPDGPTSMLPTIGGLACLIGGILTYRRRGKNDA
jgi:hypothetical protein